MALHTAGMPVRNILSLCAGVGGLELGIALALHHRGEAARGVCYVEREGAAAASLVTSMEAGWLHPAPVWSDARTFDGTAWRGCVDIVTSGDPCFVPGTLVLTSAGYRPIEELAVGDLVLTHLGRWRPVTNVMQREGATLRRLKAPGVPGVVTTHEHPFWVRSRGKVWDNARRRYVRQFGEAEWIAAGDIGKSTHYLSQVLPMERDRDISRELLWVLGRWLADGWRQQRKSRGGGLRNRKRRGKVLICCGKHEIDEVRTGLRAAGISWWENDQRTSMRFNIADQRLWDLLDAFGRGADGKTIPGWALELPPSKAAALLDGYISGDGSRAGVVRTITTVSKSLALGAAMLAQRAFGVVATVHFNRTADETVIEGRRVRQRDFFTVGIPDSNRSSFVDGAYGWKLCRSAEPAGVGTVFNISVADDESYVADGAVVHNCQGNSVAGKRLGELDDRWLLDRAIDIFAQSGAHTFFRENVPGNADGQLAVAVPALERLGCRVAAGIFSSAETGNTMRRERVFVMAERQDLGHERGGDRRLAPDARRGSIGRVAADGPSCSGERDVDARSPDLASASVPRPQGIEHDKPNSSGRQDQKRHAGLRGRAILPPAVIPGPTDSRWIDVLDRWPELQPALSEEEAQSHLRRGIDAMAHRIERLRATGNGVDPVVAAYAFLSLDACLRADERRRAA